MQREKIDFLVAVGEKLCNLVRDMHKRKRRRRPLTFSVATSSNAKLTQIRQQHVKKNAIKKKVFWYLLFTQVFCQNKSVWWYIRPSERLATLLTFPNQVL